MKNSNSFNSDWDDDQLTATYPTSANAEDEDPLLADEDDDTLTDDDEDDDLLADDEDESYDVDPDDDLTTDDEDEADEEKAGI